MGSYEEILQTPLVFKDKVYLQISLEVNYILILIVSFVYKSKIGIKVKALIRYYRVLVDVTQFLIVICLFDW